ncbi:hypothetical protein [Reyranella sp.]|jgi:hypothetical protein|uniref:hypothetical protein n=1 Tax=Reyranella sp. TaxID=1929291 RepID=UPI002F91FC40
MFSLSWERKRHVLLIRFSDVLTSRDMAETDLAIVEFVAEHGRGDTIYDFTATTAVAIPQTGFVARRYQPPLSPGSARIIVAPRDDLRHESLEFAEQQAELGFLRPHVTRTLEEAFGILRLGARPVFELLLAPALRA